MSELQQDQREGFSELLALAGEDMSFEGTAFRALIRIEKQEKEAFDLTAGDDTTVTVSFLSDALKRAPEIGENLIDGNGIAYRLTERVHRPGAIILRYAAQLS